MFMVPRILAGKTGRFARTDLFLPALDVAELVLAARGQSTAPIEAMRREALPPAAREARRPSSFPAPARPPLSSLAGACAAVARGGASAANLIAGVRGCLRHDRVDGEDLEAAESVATAGASL